MKIDVKNYKNEWSLKNKICRMIWSIVWLFLFRPSPRVFYFWRRILLRIFGARIGRGVHIYPSCRILAPWMLEMADYSCLSFDVDCWNIDIIRIGMHATVSQYSFLCSAGHDICDKNMKMIHAPIIIGSYAWISASVFVGPGVTIGEGSVCAARSVVIKDVPDWSVVGGHPAKYIKQRIIRESII